MAKSSRKTIHIETGYDTIDFEGYSCELSSYSYIPPTRKNQIKERSYFNCQKQTKSAFLYDKIFQIKSDYNQKAHRDDRQHSKLIGLNLAKEEEEKSYPTRSSTEYGRRHHQFNDLNDRSHLKIEHVRNEFYRSNGVIHK